MPHDPYKALYIHVPFCASRCDYCDFHTEAIKPESRAIDRYFDSLIERLRDLSREGELAQVKTVYVGGGTPTHAGSKNLTQLLYALGVSMHLDACVECTIEANPESLNERLVADIWALGANRLSIGVQSFDDALLGSIGRIHSADDAKRAIECAHTRFSNVSVDLMCGLPGQTIGQFEDSVREAVSAGVSHVSVYPLTIERGTKLARRMARGKLELPSDDTVADMMESAAAILAGEGFARYEVASYAKPGCECAHNIAYWSGVPYLGVGHSAATMTQNDQRRMRVTDDVVTDDLDTAQMAAEDLMLAMRMSRGVKDDDLDRVATLLPNAHAVFADLECKGLVKHSGGRWVPTNRGWLLGNELYGEILDLSEGGR